MINPGAYLIDVRPIQTGADYDWALAELDVHFLDQPPLGTLASDRFEVLATLVEAYEAKHWPIVPASAFN